MPEGAIIQRIFAGDLPGSLRKRLTVPEGSLALLVQGQEVTGQRESGEYHLGNWPKPALDVVFLPQGPFDLRPRIQSLKSGDRQPFDLAWPLTLQVTDPVRFFTAWLAAAPDPAFALQDLEDYLAGLLWEEAQAQAVQYGMDDLQAEAQVQSSLARALRPALVAALGNLGLTLVGSQRPEPRTMDEERAELEAMNQLVRAERDARFEALFERLDDEQMLADRLTEWFAERGEGPPDPALVDRLWQVIDQGPEEAALRAQQAAEALQREVAALRLTLQSERTDNERHFRQLTVRLESAEKALAEAQAPEEDPAAFLRSLLYLLRLVGSCLTLAGALITLYAPQMADQYQHLQLVALIVTVVTAALTILSDLFLQQRMRRVRAQAAEAKLAESRASLQQRRQTDRLVRARVEAGLKQVTGSLEAAWKKGYDAGGAARDLAVDLRQAARQAAHFGEQDVRAANYQAGRYLAQDRVPDGQLAAVLDLDEDLLTRSQTLAQTAESLYQQVNAGQVETARESLRELENGLHSLRNRFTERGAYLMKPV